MSEIQLAHFSFGGDRYERSRIHEIAIHEARIASEVRYAEPIQPRGLLARLGLSRLMPAGLAAPPTVETCNCPA